MPSEWLSIVKEYERRKREATERGDKLLCDSCREREAIAYHPQKFETRCETCLPDPAGAGWVSFQKKAS